MKGVWLNQKALAMNGWVRCHQNGEEFVKMTPILELNAIGTLLDLTCCHLCFPFFFSFWEMGSTHNLLI